MGTEGQTQRRTSACAWDLPLLVRGEYPPISRRFVSNESSRGSTPRSRIISGERPRHNGVWRAPENLVPGNRIAKDGVDQHAPPVAREQDQHLLLDLADLHDVLPPHPPPTLAEP